MDSATSSDHEGEAAEGSPSLDTLVGHLLAAKRSLACLEHVSRANGLVTSTRAAMEAHAAHAARAGFLHRGCRAQVAALQRIQAHAGDLAGESGAEHAAAMARLGEADGRLGAALDRLRATAVEPSLRPQGEEPKSLADFVDETGVQGLREAVGAALQSFDAARTGFEALGRGLDRDVDRVQELLAAAGGLGAGSGAPADQSAIPALFARMNANAREMAANLESLVKHFDLCITAIKHTEGGDAAASKVASDLPEGFRAHLEQSTDLDPISPEERQEMLDVLRKDAAEVDDVVSEIKDGLLEMEADYQHVEAAAELQVDQARRTAEVLSLLDEVGARLPKYTTQTQLFLIRWDEEKSRIEEHMAEFDGLRDFYAGFIDAYSSLIIEVGRRKDTEKRVEKVRRDALAKIDKLLTEEVAERNHFRQDQGDFLPADIWPGLVTSPAKYDFVAVEGTDDSLPDISASTIKRAIKSLEGSGRSSHA